MAWFGVDKERLRTVDHRELWSEEGRLTGRGKVFVLEIFNSVEGYEGFSSVSEKRKSTSFSLADSDVYIVYHSNVLGNHEAVQRRRFLRLVSEAWWNESRVLRAVQSVTVGVRGSCR